METKTGETKKLGFWEKTDRWITGLMAVPLFGIVVKKTFENIAEKGGEVIEKKIKKTLGTDTDEAAKDSEDETIYGAALKALPPDERKEMNNFEIRLRASQPKKAESFVLWISKIVKSFEIERKETINPPKGSKDPKIETVVRDITVGVEHAIVFIRDVLAQTGPTPDETFAARVAFLEGKNAFSLIPKEKDPGPVSKAATEIINKAARMAGEAVNKIPTKKEVNKYLAREARAMRAETKKIEAEIARKPKRGFLKRYFGIQ